VALLVLLQELHGARELVLDSAAHLHHGIRGAEANALQRTETLDEARVLVTSLVRSRELAAQAA